jgi:hypothetical protein
MESIQIHDSVLIMNAINEEMSQVKAEGEDVEKIRHDQSSFILEKLKE